MQDNRLIHWLVSRGISQSVIDDFGLCAYEHRTIGSSIKIPITENWAKYRRDPVSDIKPKYIYDKGGSATLYGYDKLNEKHESVIITEGELDTLICWSNNIPAISSTGGANTFHEEWGEMLKGRNVILAYDNDDAGSRGMVKVLKIIPTAKVVLIPEKPNIKDLTDYVKYGGDLRELIKGAIQFNSLEEVKEDRARRIATFLSVRFHDAYIEEYLIKEIPKSLYKPKDNTRLEKAKNVPITDFLEFKGKPPQRCCIFHKEKTASLTYYPKTNSVYCFGCSKHGDVIDVYRELHNCDFKTALDKL